LRLIPGDIADWSGIVAINSGSFLERQVTIVVEEFTQEACMFLGIDDTDDSPRWLRISTCNGMLAANHDNNVIGLIPLDLTRRVWQIREQAGTVYFETSVDGVQFATFATAATPDYVDDANVSLGGGTDVTVTMPGIGRVDSIEDCGL